MVASAAHPQVLWAQREDILFVTIVLSDIQDEKIQLTDDALTFSAKAGAEAKEYAAELKFFKPIDTQVTW